MNKPGALPQQLGEWKLEKQLGRGGQGAVYQARYVRDRHCPLRAMKICDSPDPKAKSRFKREVDLLSVQSHPGIVRVIDSGSQNGIDYFVMERASTTLDQIKYERSAGTRLLRESTSIILRMFKEACLAVAHLHAQDWLHRDIKPQNILLMLDPPEPMRAMIADLGTASMSDEQGQITAPHETVGTPAYRAPETSVEVHTKASDVYSLGKTLEFIFSTRSLAIGPGTCARDGRMSEDLWDEIDEVIAKACDFEPRKRFTDASDLAKAIPQPWLVGKRHSMLKAAVDPSLIIENQDLILLASIISRCPLEDRHVTVWDLEKSNDLGDFELAISIRRLIEVGVIERTSVENHFGENFDALRPTKLGYLWGQTRREEIRLAISSAVSNRDDRLFGDEEIPF